MGGTSASKVKRSEAHAKQLSRGLWLGTAVSAKELESGSKRVRIRRRRMKTGRYTDDESTTMHKTPTPFQCAPTRTSDTACCILSVCFPQMLNSNVKGATDQRRVRCEFCRRIAEDLVSRRVTQGPTSHTNRDCLMLAVSCTAAKG